MLPKTNRVKNKKDFEVIFKKGTNFKNSIFILKFLKNNLNYTRFGFVVSQKVSKKAVVRNKIRRRFSEAIQLHAKEIKTGLDIVLIALPNIDKKKFSEIKESVAGALIKTKLISNG